MSLLDFAHRSPVDWFVIFEETNARPWYWGGLKDGYTHVYAIRWDGFNWIKVDPTIGYVDVKVLEYGFHDTLFDVVDPGYSDILHITAWREINRVRIPWVLGAITCVEAIKSLLGIRAPFVITPWQLAKYLRGNHGIETEKTTEISRPKRA